MTNKTSTRKRSPKSPATPGKQASCPEEDSRPAPATDPAGKPASKIQKVIDLLERPDGTSLDELISATGWQPHTTRAALTGLKKKGYSVSSDKVGEVRRYRVSRPQ